MRKGKKAPFLFQLDFSLLRQRSICLVELEAPKFPVFALPRLGRLCFLAPYLRALFKYKNVIKNNTISSVIHIIVCLPKTE